VVSLGGVNHENRAGYAQEISFTSAEGALSGPGNIETIFGRSAPDILTLLWQIFERSGFFGIERSRYRGGSGEFA
jgi:hypothetical protein